MDIVDIYIQTLNIERMLEIIEVIESRQRYWVLKKEVPILFQLNNIAPARGVVGTLKLMLYRIGKPCRLPAAILAPKLLRPQDDRLCPVHLVQPVQHLVQPLHLLKLLRVKVESGWTV